MQLLYVTGILWWWRAGHRAALPGRGLCPAAPGWGASRALGNCEVSQVLQSGSGASWPCPLPCWRQKLAAFRTCPVCWCSLTKAPQGTVALLTVSRTALSVRVFGAPAVPCTDGQEEGGAEREEAGCWLTFICDRGRLTSAAAQRALRRDST